MPSSPRGKFYYAMYDFTPEAGEVTLLRVVRGQAVRVVQVAFYLNFCKAVFRLCKNISFGGAGLLF